MARSAKSAGPPKKDAEQGSHESAPEQGRPDRLAFTMDAKTGEIVQVEGIDASGARHELTRDEAIGLAKQNGQARLEQLLEEAFEAGIACVLGGEDEPGEQRESKADADIHRLLLEPLIEHSPAARLMQEDVLDRAIVETLIHHSLTSRSKTPPKPGPTKDAGSDRVAPSAT